MAGVADKARFFLERSVPQLREWEEKSIFSKVRESSSKFPSASVANIQSRMKSDQLSKSETISNTECFPLEAPP
jgi:hypothetical protein